MQVAQVGLEPPSGSRRRLFSRQVPHPAGCLPLVFAIHVLRLSSVARVSDRGVRIRNQGAAGAGIEPTSRRSERPVLPLDDPASIIGDTLVSKRLGEKESNLRFLVQSQAACR